MKISALLVLGIGLAFGPAEPDEPKHALAQAPAPLWHADTFG